MSASALVAFLRAELGARPGRMRAALRTTAAALIASVVILGLEMPHGSWAIFTVFTVSMANAGASLKRGLERLVGTFIGGLAGLLAVMIALDAPYVFVPLLGLAVTVGLYLSGVLATAYPPLLGALTYILVALSHVDYPEDFVGVALWRMTAIMFGVVLGTGAQLFLWPDDPLDKLRLELVRRLDLVCSLIEHAIAPPTGTVAAPPTQTLALGDVTEQLQLLANAEVLHPRLRTQNAEHIALILEVARLFTDAAWAAETTPETAARVGLDEGVRQRLVAIRDESARLARALEARRSLLGSTEPTTALGSAAATPTVAAAAPVLGGMERSIDRIAFLTGGPMSGRASAEDRGAGLLSPRDVMEPRAPRLLPLDTAVLRRALKTALGAELCYLLMLGFNWPGLLTAPVTCVVVGQSTVGATLSKAVLRQVGALLGGGLGVIIIVVLMPNLHGLASYLVVLAIGYGIAAWITVGGPRTAYAGIQTALALGIMLVNQFGPTTDLTSGRDRVLGILLGAAVMGAIDQVLWPVQARLAMRPTIARALRLMGELARAGGRGQVPGDHPRGLRAKIYRTLAATLQLREDSRMEGDPDTPETRAESDMILRLVTDAQAAMPGLLAAAGERVAAGSSGVRTAFSEHVEEFERTIAQLLDATADSVEGKPVPELGELRARARHMEDAADVVLAAAPVGTALDEATTRLQSRHLTNHQLLRLVARLAPDA